MSKAMAHKYACMCVCEFWYSQVQGRQAKVMLKDDVENDLSLNLSMGLLFFNVY